MIEQQQKKALDLGIDIGAFELIAVLGFLIIGLSTYLDFTPVVAKNWRENGVGMQVLVACMAGSFLMLKRCHFAGFFIVIFTAFFLTHGIIIVYDTRAIELGKEIGPDGWFRSVLMIYQDAFNVHFGAFWAMFGTVISFLGIFIGWIQAVRRDNKAARRMAEADFANMQASEAENGESEDVVEADFAEAEDA
ncbi:MAG: hypothetical protein EOM80_10610 [Erysipelotrichia bacterium]|nr:hypothetical protein [Erysipelotrichia bacterium]